MNSEGKYYGGKAVKTKKFDASALEGPRNNQKKVRVRACDPYLG